MDRRATFVRFWTAAAISSLGTAVTAVAMPVLVVTTLQASPVEVGVVNAAQFVPYALVGLLAGVYTDRSRRQPLLVWSSVGRAVTLGAIPVLWLLGSLQVWTLVALLLAFGTFSVFAFAATQSLLPSVVSSDRLVVANARLDQAESAAETLGPALGGGLVGLLGAPLAVAVDAVSYLVEAVLTASLRLRERVPTPSTSRSVRREIAEGLRWTYRHPTLGSLAISTHVWFVANAAGLTALSLLVLRVLNASALVFGLMLALSGLAMLAGATIAPGLGNRLGSARAIVASRLLYPPAWLLIALAPIAPGGTALVFVGMALHGFAGGVENPNEMGYWQRLTPDALLGRTNASRRSANRTLAALGAFLGGATVSVVGEQVALVGVVVVFAVAALITTRAAARSPDR